jgi:hypothetical protein
MLLATQQQQTLLLKTAAVLKIKKRSATFNLFAAKRR